MIDLDTHLHIETQDIPQVHFRGEAYYLPWLCHLAAFTKCMDAALALLWLQGIRVMDNLGNWLILAQCEVLAVQHRDVVITHLMCLRLRIKKLIFPPRWQLNSSMVQAILSHAHVQTVLACLDSFRSGQVVAIRVTRWLCEVHHLTWQINCMEMMPVLLALKHFLSDLRVLVLARVRRIVTVAHSSVFLRGSQT